MCKVRSRVNKKQGSMKTADVGNCYNEFLIKKWRIKVQPVRDYRSKY